MLQDSSTQCRKLTRCISLSIRSVRHAGIFSLSNVRLLLPPVAVHGKLVRRLVDTMSGHGVHWGRALL